MFIGIFFEYGEEVYRTWDAGSRSDSIAKIDQYIEDQLVPLKSGY